MNRIKIKQGTLAWEKLRSAKIGSSEVFDIVRYYALPEELLNCGIDAEKISGEKPYTTAWALYHKILNDGFYKKEKLPEEFAEYGHCVEPYGMHVLQKGREKKLKSGLVFANDRLIASLDVSGTAEKIDEEHGFDYGTGAPKTNEKFVCEQKTMMPERVKKGIPYKYIIQAQYQILQTKADFYILQIMILNEDTPFIRGKICQMSRKKKFEYLDANMKVMHFYFKNNAHLSKLIEVCLERFFEDVKNKKEPLPFIECDSQQNIIESIRLNSAFDDEKKICYDLSHFMSAKKQEDTAEEEKKNELQKIIELAKQNNAVSFYGTNAVGKFSKNGRFLTKELKDEALSISE